MKPVALLALTLSASDPSPSRVDAVSNFHCGTAQAVATAELEQTEAAYGERSVAIITASLSNDRELLKRFVAPGARTTIFHFDAGSTSPPYGPESVRNL